MKSGTRMIFGNETDSKPGLVIANHRKGEAGHKQLVTRSAVMEQETVHYVLLCFAAVVWLNPAAGHPATADHRLTGHAPQPRIEKRHQPLFEGVS